MDIRHQLLHAVYTLAQRQAIKDMTVNDILAEAEVSRGSFYKYFADKYDVVNSYYEEAMTEIFKDCDAFTWQGIFTKMTTYLEKHRVFFRAAFQNEGQNAFTQFFRDYLNQKFAAIITTHSSHQALSTDERKAVRFFVDGFVTYTRQWILSDTPQSATDLGYELHLFMPEILCRIRLDLPVTTPTF
ncbi:TetR/AcrR family transcriptional regulator [Levilactobacillus lanxiensis]|uniref:TetR/AcrR family transcriptional regulator n=1 Tax=Levilactobacillus lanxiensis TaxID=2799568 RepID=A0ABW4D9S8_9LACO|nr:TetR/AcrR family transcriptional regulator [Levilactobacillus lanxiensis]